LTNLTLAGCYPDTLDGNKLSFQIGNEQFFVVTKKSRACAKA